MFRALSSLLVIALATPTLSQADVPLSPCPNVFMYETASNEPGRWYGVVNLVTDNILHGLWLNIMLDSKADILGNWVGDVTTTDNMEFKIENTKKKINPQVPAEAVRFFVQYNALSKTPKLKAIRLNGREICNANNRQPVVDRPEPDRPVETRPVETRPIETRPIETRPIETRPIETRPKPGGNTKPLPDSIVTSQQPNIVIRPVYVPTENPPLNQSNVISYSISGGSQIPAQSVGIPAHETITRTPTSSVGTQYTVPTSGSRPSNVGTQFTAQNSGTRPSNSNPQYTVQNSDNRPSQTTVIRNPSQSVGTQIQGQNVGTQTGNRPEYQATPTPTRPSDNSDDDYDSGDKTDPAEYFTGGPITFIVNSNNNNNNFFNNNNIGQEQCGKVVKNPNPLVVNGQPTKEGQWPWQIALYQTQTVDNKYICGGTLVSRRHVITAAHCVTRKGSAKVVNKNTLTIYLGKHNLRTSVEGVQIMLVANIKVHPNYNASSFSRDLAILTLRSSVEITEYVRPACLWPETETDLSYVIGQKGSVVGWGFDDTGVATEELTLVEMPVVDQETCIRSYSEFFARFTSEYTFCAGYRDGNYDKRTGTRKSTSVCNGDSGGGMVFDKQGTWYLRGLVSISVARQNEYRCDPTHYVVFTDLAKFSSWIRTNIGN